MTTSWHKTLSTLLVLCGFLSQWASTVGLCYFLWFVLYELSNKQSSYRWFEATCRSNDTIVIYPSSPSCLITFIPWNMCAVMFWSFCLLDCCDSFTHIHYDYFNSMEQSNNCPGAVFSCDRRCRKPRIQWQRSFQMKAALSLANRLPTVSYRCSNTGLRYQWNWPKVDG